MIELHWRRVQKDCLPGSQQSLKPVDIPLESKPIPGERVVSAANFLIDAESKVQGVEASWETPKPR